MTAERLVSQHDISEAARRLGSRVRRTPVLTVERGTFASRSEVVLKLELFQHTGSFKVRGALNTLLSKPVPKAGVVAASGGNHGLAVAYAAAALGYRAEIFVPEAVSRAKLARLQKSGADVVVTGAYYADALAACLAREAETGAVGVHAYDAFEVIAGQGTIGRELDEQISGFDTVLVAVGGGGLIGGIATWFGERVKVVAVEPVGSPTLFAALAAGKPVDVDVHGLAADSLGARRIGDHAFAVATRFVDEALVVEDDAVLEARRRLWDDVRILAEPGAAVALAALMSNAYRPAAAERVVALVCGGNTDTFP